MPRTLEFFFDLMSPYSFLASTQLEALGQRTGATVRWRVMYLPGVMKATGNQGPTAVAAKAMYSLKDINDWAKHYKLPPVELPDPFPFVSTNADRLAIAIEELDPAKSIEFCKQMFKRIWLERANCNDPAVISVLLLSLGLDAPALLERIKQEDLKAKLKGNTDEAIERGAFGAPTFFVGDEMFVGNDRLMFVEQALMRQAL